ncbi:MAG: DUF1232 domain-containing protein, partial [Chloroflexota bacterium]
DAVGSDDKIVKMTRPVADRPQGEPTKAASALAGFPGEEFGALLKRLPSYGRLAWALARDKRISRVRRAAVLAAAAYVVSPIDLVPGLIPVVGQLDDLAVALAGIRVALGGLPPEARSAAISAAGLSDDDLATDLRTTGAIAGWLARSSVRVTGKVASTAVRGGRALTRTGINAIGAIRRRRR